jgi:hypothetical protein
MSRPDGASAIVDTLRAMAKSMAASAKMSADMLEGVADDVEAGGPISRLVNDHPEVEEPLFFVRVLAGVRFLVLTGRAPALAAHLEQLTGRMGEPDYDRRTWELFADTVLTHPDEIRSAVDRPVQQHQPRRAAKLLTGLTYLSAPRIRLLEIGACAGLNLLFDQYRWFGDKWEWGATSSGVRLLAAGPRPGSIEIVERAGCDRCPRDPADPTDATILRSFLPTEAEVEQWELDEALELAAGAQVRIDKADAVDWLADQLDRRTEGRSVYTVVWHSLFWSYLSAQQQADIERLCAGAARSMPLAKISYEPFTWSTAPRLQMNVYS